MNWRRASIGLLAAALLLPAVPGAARAQDGAPEYRGAAALGLSLRKLGTTKRVLMVGAHPDDEDTQLLARFALEEGADVAYLSLTRGEGGQNGIGPELGEGLGLLRTEELLAARRVDGAEQFFTRAYDFGFSKSAEETFAHWPREEVLRDVVRVIRLYRPDIIVTVFSGTPRDGHGQHQVSAMLAREAFDAAADPNRFPEQIAEGLRPWQVSKMYQSMRGNTENATVRVAIGDLDPLIGRSPFQLAMASRSRHRSQDMGRPELPGPRWGTLRRILPAADGEEPSAWAGIDTTLALDGPPESFTARALETYHRAVEGAQAEYNPLTPEALQPRLAAALNALQLARDSLPVTNGTADLARAIDVESAQAETALALASGVVLDVLADDARIVPGQSFELTVTLWNGGHRGGAWLHSLAPLLPAGWRAEPIDTVPAPSSVLAGTLLARRFRVHVPADADPTEAYFLRAAREGDLYRWPSAAEEAALARPFEGGPVSARVVVSLGGEPVRLEQEAQFREVDLRQGELRRPVMVVPGVSVLLEPAARVLSTAAPRPIGYTVRLVAEEAVGGTLRLELPAGWSAEPAAVPVRFARAGEVREVRFTVTAPADAREGDHPVSAVFAADDGRRFARGVQLIDYPHVRARPLYHDARSLVRAFDVRVPQGLRVAYIEGAGEEGPGFLANLGITPELLDADDLAEGDLDPFDVIIAGSRVYEVRQDVMAHNQRLLDYVERGGTFIVQYNKYEIVEGRFTPFPITMARPHGRVTDENAPMRILDPAHPVFTTPNRITEADWQGWEQERGLYFAQAWDDAYTPLLETGDPGETPLRGGLLVARHGRGTYVYTGLAFFRQFPRGVPGAYRLFANLLALGKK